MARKKYAVGGGPGSGGNSYFVKLSDARECAKKRGLKVKKWRSDGTKFGGDYHY